MFSRLLFRIYFWNLISRSVNLLTVTSDKANPLNRTISRNPIINRYRTRQETRNPVKIAFQKMTKGGMAMFNAQRNHTALRSSNLARTSRVNSASREQVWESTLTQPLPDCSNFGFLESLQIYSPGREFFQEYQYRSPASKNNAINECLDRFDTITYYRSRNKERIRQPLDLPSSDIASSHHSPLQATPCRTPRTPCNSRTLYFAGSKFGDAPPPSFVPPPPQHWINNRKAAAVVNEDPRSFTSCAHRQCCMGLTSELKVLLHVQ